MDIIAESLFASNNNNFDQMWSNTSKQFFQDSVSYIKGTDNISVKNLYDLLTRDKLSRVALKLKDYPSSSLLDPKNEKTAMSIRTNTIAFINWMKSFKETEDNISIVDWFKEYKNKNSKDDRWLFFINYTYR